MNDFFLKQLFFPNFYVKINNKTPTELEVKALKITEIVS